MIIKKSDLHCIAAKPSQYPSEDVVEIAFAGRSNVGKSSLINTLLKRKNLARVSGNPGKTRTINFYTVNDDEFRIVDLPGYGYAKVSKAESESWGKMMEDYLANRENLVCVFQLVDSRHEPTAQDKQMYEWLQYYGLDGVVIATKVDKLSRNELNKNLAMIRKSLKLDASDIIVPVSALNKTGTDDVLNVISQLLQNAEG